MKSYSCTVWVDIGYFQGLMLSHEVKKQHFIGLKTGVVMVEKSVE